MPKVNTSPELVLPLTDIYGLYRQPEIDPFTYRVGQKLLIAGGTALSFQSFDIRDFDRVFPYPNKYNKPSEKNSDKGLHHDCLNELYHHEQLNPFLEKAGYSKLTFKVEQDNE